MDDIGPLTTIIISAFVGAISGIICNVFTLKYRLRAENEYTFLREIWTKAYWLKSKTNRLRPVFDSANSNNAEVKKTRLEEFDAARADYEQVMYLHKPFYPDAIHKLLSELRNAANSEAINYYHEIVTSDDEKYWADAKASAEKIDGLVDEPCDAARCRIHVSAMYRIWQRTKKWIERAVSLFKWPIKALRPKTITDFLTGV